MSSFPRAAIALASGAALLALNSVPAHGASSTYVALGDSYSSGTGTRSYFSDGTSCQRSVYAYPALIATSRGYALNFRACSGATTADVMNLQLSAVGTGTAYATITAGGNDAGFADVLTECAKPAWASDCNGAIDRAQSIINNQLPGRLRTLYSSIRGRAPQARVVAAGYPRIFNGEDCNAFTWFSPTEESRLNATADLLNAKIQAAASVAGLVFSSPVPPFGGHAVCDDTEWINGLSSPLAESYHPNRLGHSSGYAPLVGSALTGSTVTVTTLTSQQAADSASRLATQQRHYSAKDRTIRPKTFKIPDLQSPEVKAAAARAGVNIRSRASIDAFDRAYASKQARSYR